MASNLTTPHKHSLRVLVPSSEVGHEAKLLTPTSDDSSKSWKQPPDSMSESSKALMGPPLGKPVSSTKQSPSKASQPSSPVASEDDQVDVSPESALLPVFKRVTYYTEGGSKICFVDFDRFPGPGQVTGSSVGSSAGVMEEQFVPVVKEEDFSQDSEGSWTS